MGFGGEGANKNYLPEGGKEGRVEKKSARSAPTWDLPQARRGPGLHARGLFRTSLSVPIDRVGRLRKHHVLRVFGDSFCKIL